MHLYNFIHLIGTLVNGNFFNLPVVLSMYFKTTKKSNYLPILYDTC